MKAIGKGSISSFLAGTISALWYLSLFFTAIYVLYMGVALFSEGETRIRLPVSFVVDIPPRPVTAPSLGVRKALIEGWSDGVSLSLGRVDTVTDLRMRGSLIFAPRRGAFLILHELIMVGFCGGALWMLFQLRAVLRTLRDGQPFVRANATRLRWIAFGTIGFELARSAVGLFDSYYAMAHFVGEGLQFKVWPDFNTGAIFNSLIILVIAEVFRAGTRLDEEQSLTV